MGCSLIVVVDAMLLLVALVRLVDVLWLLLVDFLALTRGAHHHVHAFFCLRLGTVAA